MPDRTGLLDCRPVFHCSKMRKLLRNLTMAKNKKSRHRKKQPPVQALMQHLPPARHSQVSNAITAANSLISRGNTSDALALCEQIAEIEPRNAEIFLTMASAYEQAGQIEAGEQAYQKAFKLAPNFLPAMVNHALMYYQAGLLEKALARFIAVLSLDADFIPALDGTARTLSDLRRYQQAVPVYEKLARLRATSVDLIELARAQELTGNIKAALLAWQRSLAVSHDRASIEIMAGMFCLSHGDKPAAIDYFQKAIVENRDAGFAYFHLAKSEGNLDRLPAIEAAIEAALARSAEKSVANVQAPLHFAKAYLLEKAGKHQQAFLSFQRANELVASVRPDDTEQHAQMLAHHQNIYTQQFIADLHETKCDQSKRPVFVTGLPRSGTTLVEQIIAGHSDASGLGEVELVPLLAPVLTNGQPESFVAAAKTYRASYPGEQVDMQRMVDKSISSVLHLGAIMSMFPNATIICCERHPMDVAWSAYKQYFNDGSLAYTYSFKRIAAHQKIYRQAVEHWQGVFDDKIFKIAYEDLVGAPEKHARRLISHVNLPWQDSCLNFHKNQTPVRTASYDQVRQPVYTTSVGSWQAYEPWLGELKTLLSAEMQRYQSK